MRSKDSLCYDKNLVASAIVQLCLFQTFLIWVVAVNSHFYLWIKLLNYAVNVKYSCIHQSLSTSLSTFQILKICVFIYEVIFIYCKFNYRPTINQNIARFNYIINCNLIVEKNMLRCCKHIQQLNMVCQCRN